jgi:3-hydroxyacyl-CoA dehydrogenase
MINEIAHLMMDGVASEASDCDIALVNGYGFPRWQGGPLFIAREMGAEALKAKMKVLAEQSGSGFELADLEILFKEKDGA